MLGISVRRAAATLFDPPIDPRHLYRAVRLGEIPRSFDIGVHKFLVPEDVEAWRDSKMMEIAA
jgi:hypothetical protein